MLRRTVPLLISEGLTILGLHNLGNVRGFGVGWNSLWLPTTRIDDAIAASLRYVALIMAYWLLASSVLYLTARLSGVPAAVRRVRWATLPIVRRVIDKAAVVSLTVGTLLAPAQALAQTPPIPVEQTYVPSPAGFGTAEIPVVVVDDEILIPPGATVPQSSPTSPGTSPVVHFDLPDAGFAAALPTHLLFGDDGSHVVVVGESLWSIAADRVERAFGEAQSDTSTAQYWIELVAANVGSLKSGDPDLIFPGESITLPPISQ